MSPQTGPSWAFLRRRRPTPDGAAPGAPRAAVYVAGLDIADVTYWTWEWEHDEQGTAPPPQVWVTVHSDPPEHPSDEPFATQWGLAAALARLDRALPGRIESESTVPASDDPATTAGLDALRGRVSGVDLPQIARVVLGEFGDPHRERELSTQLGRLLLPSELLEEVRARRRSGSRIEFRVMPSMSCARVPWELLATRNPDHPDERLADLVDVATVAPVLARDAEPEGEHPSWRGDDPRPPLFVIDPADPRVLSGTQRDHWSVHLAELAASTGHADLGEVGGRAVDRRWLHEHLADAGGGSSRSRLFYVGHVGASASEDGMPTLRLNDARDFFSRGGAWSRATKTRDFSALDLFLGSVDAARVLDEQSRPPSDLVDRYGTTTPRMPPEFRTPDPNDTVADVPGRAIWPMPPRVALIACQSGSDLQFREPFGLVTAILELGAELVTATRWTLFTDLVFSAFDEATAPLNELAVELDGIQTADDPIAALGDLYRSRLAAWRALGTGASVGERLAASPLSWASITHHHAPDRRVPR